MKKKCEMPVVSRRHFVLRASSLLALTALPQSGWTQTRRDQSQTLSGQEFDLHIGAHPVNYTGKQRVATVVNETLPGPVLRWKEGERVTIHVTNHLKEMTSIHWHGLILPSNMDGVPGLSFDGIQPGETFTYEFDVQQSGTYWYHSHSGYQEQTGLFGAIIIEPQQVDPVLFDREHVIFLSDWSDTAPATIYSNLKKKSHYYNYRERTVGDFWREMKQKGFVAAWQDRTMWNEMRMSDTDIADVNGYAYTYLMNGVTPDAGWLGVARAGERVRLRIINGSSMTLFDVRIPGLTMTVVAADGQNIQPVSVDEFRMGVAETYDVIVEPEADQAYTIFAQSVDRTGYARGTLTTNPSIKATVPEMDPPPVLGHQEMGMGESHQHHAHAEAVDSSLHEDHHNHTEYELQQSSANHAHHESEHSHHQHEMPQEHTHHHNDHDDHSHQHAEMSHHDHHGGHDASSAHQHGMQVVETSLPAPRANLTAAGFGHNFAPEPPLSHAETEFGPHVDNRAMSAPSGLTDPGIGLRDHQQRYGRRVLTYADLRGLTPTRDTRQPTREIELHLTGNMHRYMWSLNGVSYMDAAPIQLQFGERIRIVLVNDTMMIHPIHLHGLWSELETGDPNYIPRKHTVLVQPGSRISYLVTADTKGRWAYHCHLLYHMAGMMREVRVS